MGDDPDKRSKPDFSMGVAVAIGVAIGAAIGATLDNIALGIGIGAAIGIALGIAGYRRRQQGLVFVPPGGRLIPG